MSDTRIELDPLQRLIYERNTSIGLDGKIWLKVGVQSFALDYETDEGQEAMDWYRRCVAVALTNLVRTAFPE